MRTQRKTQKLPAAEDASTPGPRVATLVGVSADGSPLIQLQGESEPRKARSFLGVTPAALKNAAYDRPDVVVLFERDDLNRPLVLALQPAPSATPLVDALLSAPAAVEAPPSPVAVTADGKRILIEAEHEIVLKCGEASITLRRDGEVVVRGVKVESRATGRHIIRGGKIELN